MGSSAKKAPAGEYEKAVVDNSNTIANRHKELYRPLQEGFVKESGRDVSAVLGGRANADTAIDVDLTSLETRVSTDEVALADHVAFQGTVAEFSTVLDANIIALN